VNCGVIIRNLDKWIDIFYALRQNLEQISYSQQDNIIVTCTNFHETNFYLFWLINQKRDGIYCYTRTEFPVHFGELFHYVLNGCESTDW